MSDEKEFTAVGIGKIIIDNNEEGWNFPHFHIVLLKEDSEYTAFCLELGVDGYSSVSGKDAFENAVTRSVKLLDRFNKNELFDHLHLTAKNDANDIFWKEYRIIETTLAEHGKDLGATSIEELKTEIETLRRQLNRDKANNKVIQLLNFVSTEKLAS